jgi:predicted nucleic acid-binding protein
VDERVARVWGALAAACLDRGMSTRRQTMDLLIAATAQVLGAALVTYDRDLAAISDLVDLRILG